MSKDKDRKTTVPKVTHIKIGDSKKQKAKSFIDFATEYTQKSKHQNTSDEVEFSVDDKIKSEIDEHKANNKKIRVDESKMMLISEESFEVPYKIKEKLFPSPKGLKQDKKNAAERRDEVSFFPRFLQKQESIKKSLQAEQDSPIKNKKLEDNDDLKFLTTSNDKFKENLGAKNVPSLNSFSSIFNRDSSSIAGVKRVFKKSIIMMTLSFLSFAILSFLSTHLFSINPLWIMVFQILFVAITNIFYIVVADRSYMQIGIALQSIAFLMANSFVGQGFSIPTLFTVLVITILLYFGYSDVEKTQLSSRLFSINHITSDSVRMLSVVVSIILSVGIFNGALSSGSEDFLRKEIFQNEFVREKIIMGDVLPGINKIFLESVDIFESADIAIAQTGLEEDPDSDYNLYSFIYLNYQIHSGSGIISDLEIANLRLDSSVNLKEEQEKITRQKAEEFRQEVYKRLPYTLDTVLTKEKLNKVVEESYIFMINKFESGKNDSLSQIVNIPLIPRNYILPGILAILIFTISFLFNFVLRFAINALTSILWFFLKKFDFARIDIENVEAEVVTI